MNNRECFFVVDRVCDRLKVISNIHTSSGGSGDGLMMLSGAQKIALQECSVQIDEVEKKFEKDFQLDGHHVVEVIFPTLLFLLKSIIYSIQSAQKNEIWFKFTDQVCDVIKITNRNLTYPYEFREGSMMFSDDEKMKLGNLIVRIDEFAAETMSPSGSGHPGQDIPDILFSTVLFLVKTLIRGTLKRSF